jgi:hypothetical protein
MDRREDHRRCAWFRTDPPGRSIHAVRCRENSGAWPESGRNGNEAREGGISLFEELVLNKQTVKVYLIDQHEPLCGVVMRYNRQKGLLVLDPHVVIPEKYILKIEVEEPMHTFRP